MTFKQILAAIIAVFIIIMLLPVNNLLRYTLLGLSLAGYIIFFVLDNKPIDLYAGLLFYTIGLLMDALTIWKVLVTSSGDMIFSLTESGDWSIKRFIFLTLSFYFFWFVCNKKWLVSFKKDKMILPLIPFISQLILMLVVIGFNQMSVIRWLIFVHALASITIFGIEMKQVGKKKPDLKPSGEKK